MRRSPGSLGSALALVGALSGCAAYHAAPLTTKAHLQVPTDDALRVWTVADVVSRALRDNADLKALRTQKRVAAAQRLSSGLLPDPSFSGAVLPLLAGPGATLAWNAALSEDLRALVTLRARRAGTKAAVSQVDAQILWQEWQIAAQARLLAVQLIEGEKMLMLLEQSRKLFADRSMRLQAALATSDASLATVAADLAALQTARSQTDAAQRLQLSRRHQLNALLNREPDAPLAMTANADMPPLDVTAVGDLQELAQRRPDLVALRLGYEAQEARVRQAILMQFPAFNLGVTGGSDNSNVRSGGPQVATSLPLFDGNRGDIAVQKATRLQLQAEYQARLNTAYGQLRASFGELSAAQASMAAVRADLPAAASAMRTASQARDAGNLDALAYVDLASAYFAKETEIAALEETVLEQQLSIAAVTGAGLPEMVDLSDAAS